LLIEDISDFLQPCRLADGHAGLVNVEEAWVALAVVRDLLVGLGIWISLAISPEAGDVRVAQQSGILASVPRLAPDRADVVPGDQPGAPARRVAR
jgi:hypothetical protein